MSRTALAETARIIRGLAADGVQKANSGHPGLPLGCAELGASLYGELLSHDPKAPQWPNRDRFILSAGHGSMLQYACLHLAGYKVTLDDLKAFRQWGSCTPGHPEFGHTEGVECTTGPLGQGIANAVGMALGAKIKARRFNTPEHTLIDHHVVALCGDGCLMEGISYEATSLAGHLGLDNLILIYDANQISLDAALDKSFTENVKLRFESMGWAVEAIDGHDLGAIASSYAASQKRLGKPSLIIARTVIGKGAPTKSGSHKVHGSPLGDEEIKKMKESLGLPAEAFYVSPEARAYFEGRRQQWESSRRAWEATFSAWRLKNPSLAKQWDEEHDLKVSVSSADLPSFPVGKTVATRKASQEILQALAAKIPNFIGGSADLGCSNLTNLDAYPDIQAGKFEGRNIYYGVREHAMGAVSNGLSLYGGFIPFCATFLVFADYLRPAIRLAALTARKVIYVFTHDSYMVGEDGPTHQPVETLAGLRSIPGLTVYRPADANETAQAYLDALSLKGPAVLALTRQNVTTLPETAALAAGNVSKGGYVIRREAAGKRIDHVLLATGSEVELALKASELLSAKGLNVRVVSLPSFERFEAQAEGYRSEVLGDDSVKRWAIEAQVSFGWHKYTGPSGGCITLDRFGACAPGEVLREKFGFTPEKVAEKILASCAKRA